MWNGERRLLTSLISNSVTVPADVVPQSVTAESFELATDFDDPRGAAAPADYLDDSPSGSSCFASSRFSCQHGDRLREAGQLGATGILSRCL